MILTHVLIAISSVIYATYIYFSPSQTRLRISYSLIASTIASGTYLVWIKPTHMMQSCLTGLVYIGGMSIAVVVTQRKLAKDI